MKKIFYLLCMAMVMLVGFNSCDKDKPELKPGFEYSLQSNGEVEGIVDLQFPNGHFDANGVATLDFAWSNVELLVTRDQQVYQLEDALNLRDTKVQSAAQDVNKWLGEQFNVTSTEGYYYIAINGYVKETLTGFVFNINKEWTNRPIQDDENIDNIEVPLSE